MSYVSNGNKHHVLDISLGLLFILVRHTTYDVCSCQISLSISHKHTPVLDEPVVLASLRAVSHCQHTVVQALVATFHVGVHALLVESNTNITFKSQTCLCKGFML